VRYLIFHVYSVKGEKLNMKSESGRYCREGHMDSIVRKECDTVH
jgi:hypothetical protein